MSDIGEPLAKHHEPLHLRDRVFGRATDWNPPPCLAAAHGVSLVRILAAHYDRLRREILGRPGLHRHTRKHLWGLLTDLLSRLALDEEAAVHLAAAARPVGAEELLEGSYTHQDHLSRESDPDDTWEDVPTGGA